MDNGNKNMSAKNRINVIASHMFKQYQEHQEATVNTAKMFTKVLDDIEIITDELREAFVLRGVSPKQVFCTIDADRSVGIINILWHSMSFTTRGNTKPQALFRKDKDPLFTGRIIALNGDFQDASLDIQDQEYPDILTCEIASLYIPPSNDIPAIMKIKHLGDEEFEINQADASKQFLLKVIEIICGGGIYHENEPDYGDE